MSNNNISLYGSVPLIINGEEFLSLTGSATVLNIGGYRILVDLGLFQGGKGADYFNEKNQDFLNGFDAVIISHPHIDHVGRLPLLYKNGFRGKIYMTKASKDITKAMLMDTLLIEQGDREERLRRNHKLGFRLRKALKIKNYISSLKENNYENNKEKSSIEDYLNKQLGKNYNKNKVLKKLDSYLDFYKVYTEDDIKDVIEDLNKTLFTEEEMQEVLKLIVPLEYSEEEILSSKKVNQRNGNLENNDLLENLPERIASGYNEEVFVDFKSDKRRLKNIWKEKLRKEIKRVIDSNKSIEIYKEKLKKELIIAYNFCYRQYFFLNDDIDNNTFSDSNKTDFEKAPEYKTIRKQFFKYKKLLEKYNIYSKKDIDTVLDDSESIIDALKIDMSFNSEDIKKAIHLLKVKNKKNNKRKIIGLTLSNAKHIVGSASINLVAGEVKGKVQDLIEINGDAISVFLSGDLGRINNNRLGKPELPTLPVDLLQIETTYAGKEHRNREESVNDLMEYIKDSKGDVLIATFAQHRTQEVLMTILEELLKKKKNGDNIDDYEILVDTPLGQKLTILYVEYEGEIFDLLDYEIQKKFFGKVMFRFLSEGEWVGLYNEEYNEEYIEHNLEFKKYPINKKRVILSASGMMEGGAIRNHLTQILENKDATILTPGYLCHGTLGYKIVMEKEEQVTIGKQKYEVNCNSKFIDGFSSHISHSEILSYIYNSIKSGKLKLDATISLNHGNREGQELLKKDIEEMLEILDRKDIKIVILDLFENYSIDSRKVSKPKKQDLKIVSLSKKQVVTPSFLLGQIDEEKDIVIEDEEVKILREKNNNILSNFKTTYFKIRGSIKRYKDNFIINFFSGVYNSIVLGSVGKTLGKISDLSGWQEKRFSGLINRKLSRNSQIKSNISILKNKIKNINIILGLIKEFKNNVDYIYPKQILELELEIEKIEKEISELDLNFKSSSEKEKYDRDYFKHKQYKKRKITELKNKIQELKYKMTGDTTVLEGKINQKEKDVLIIQNQIKQISEKEKRNKNDKLLLKELNNKLSRKKKEIKDLKRKIIKIKEKRNNFKKRLKLNISDNFYKELDEIFEKLWQEDNSNEYIKKLSKLCKEATSVIEEEIIILIGELHAHIDISFTRKEANFDGRNLYEELFLNGNLDINKLRNLLKEGIFSEKEEEFILKQLRKIEKVNGAKRRKKEILIELSSFFKGYPDLYNGDLGANIKKLKELLQKKEIKEDIIITLLKDLDNCNNILGNKDSKKDYFKKAVKSLKRFFKNKQKQNEDLGINFNLNIEELNNQLLNILKQMFIQEYYNDFIYSNFNIYLFLKSKKTFKDYIQEKYNLEKLRGVEDKIYIYDEDLVKLEDLEKTLQELHFNNKEAKELTELEQISFGIDITIDITKKLEK